jgi:hypothetical protein
MPKLSYRFIPIPQRLYESIMLMENPYAQRLGMIIAKMMFCHFIKEVTLDIYEIKALGIPEKKVWDTIEQIKAIGWYEVDTASDKTRATFTKPRTIQMYDDHLNPIITELIDDAIRRNKNKDNNTEEKER